MSGTKKCRMCGSDIANIAKKCPYCRSFQSRLFNPLVGTAAILLFYLVVVIVLVLPMCEIFDGCGYSEDYSNEFSRNYSDQAVISESKLLFGEGNCGPTVVVLGTIKNQSKVNWGDVNFQVNFYNSNNELFDTDQEPEYDFFVPAGAAVPFKISFLREFPQEQYDRYEITVLNAEKNF